MRILSFFSSLLGLIVSIITIAAFASSGGIKFPVKSPPIDVDFAYIILILGGALYITGFVGIKGWLDDELCLDDEWIILFGILYFIPLAIIVYLALRMFGHPKALLLDQIFGLFVDLLTPR